MLLLTFIDFFCVYRSSIDLLSYLQMLQLHSIQSLQCFIQILQPVIEHLQNPIWTPFGPLKTANFPVFSGFWGFCGVLKGSIGVFPDFLNFTRKSVKIPENPEVPLQTTVQVRGRTNAHLNSGGSGGTFPIFVVSAPRKTVKKTPKNTDFREFSGKFCTFFSKFSVL